MEQKEQKERLNPPEDVKSKAKVPYVKPEVRHERVFETAALSCGKVQVTETTCSGNRKTS
jgi:hypothetical protein